MQDKDKNRDPGRARARAKADARCALRKLDLLHIIEELGATPPKGMDKDTILRLRSDLVRRLALELRA